MKRLIVLLLACTAAAFGQNNLVVENDQVRILKVTVLVASTAEFTEQHLVANGCSNMLVSVLGDKGKHARAAFGVASLPFGAAVEIEAVVEV